MQGRQVDSGALGVTEVWRSRCRYECDDEGVCVTKSLGGPDALGAFDLEGEPVLGAGAPGVRLKPGARIRFIPSRLHTTVHLRDVPTFRTVHTLFDSRPIDGQVCAHGMDTGGWISVSVVT